jgi:hypothetical protein
VTGHTGTEQEHAEVVSEYLIAVLVQEPGATSPVWNLVPDDLRPCVLGALVGMFHALLRRAAEDEELGLSEYVRAVVKSMEPSH